MLFRSCLLTYLPLPSFGVHTKHTKTINNLSKKKGNYDRKRRKRVRKKEKSKTILKNITEKERAIGREKERKVGERREKGMR